MNSSSTEKWLMASLVPQKQRAGRRNGALPYRPMAVVCRCRSGLRRQHHMRFIIILRRLQKVHINMIRKIPDMATDGYLACAKKAAAAHSAENQTASSPPLFDMLISPSNSVAALRRTLNI